MIIKNLRAKILSIDGKILEDGIIFQFTSDKNELVYDNPLPEFKDSWERDWQDPIKDAIKKNLNANPGQHLLNDSIELTAVYTGWFDFKNKIYQNDFILTVDTEKIL